MRISETSVKNQCHHHFLFLSVSPPGPSKSFILNTCMICLNNICKWEAGYRGGGAYFKTVNSDDLMFGVNKFILIHVSMIRMCNKIN